SSRGLRRGLTQALGPPMHAALDIRSSLEHDGDGLVRYSVRFSNRDFSASTSVWASVGAHLDLAAALEGFPTSSSSEVRYRLGTPGTGCCELEFSCTDALGHIGVWANIESTYPVGRSAQH